MSIKTFFAFPLFACWLLLWCVSASAQPEAATAGGGVGPSGAADAGQDPSAEPAEAESRNDGVNPEIVPEPRAEALPPQQPSASELPPNDEDVSRRPQAPRARRFALGAVMGWNSLVGFGLALSYSAIPQLTLEAAVGLGAIGFKLGGRVRYNLLESSWTPMLGLGLQYGPGSGKSIEVNGSDGPATLKIDSSVFAQGIVGVRFQGARGFSFLAGLVYSHLLAERNVSGASGASGTIAATRTAAGGGFGAEFAVGYAF